MGIKTYERMEVTSNLDAAIALARTLYDLEDERITDIMMTPGIPHFTEFYSRIWWECYLTLNDASRNIGYDLEPICNAEDTYHYVEVRDFLTNEPVGCWDDKGWYRF